MRTMGCSCCPGQCCLVGAYDVTIEINGIAGTECGCEELNGTYLFENATVLNAGGSCSLSGSHTRYACNSPPNEHDVLLAFFVEMAGVSPQIFIELHVGAQPNPSGSGNWLLTGSNWITALCNGQTISVPLLGYQDPFCTGTPTATITISTAGGGGGGGGGAGASFAPTHDIELEAQGIGPASCPTGCNELNNAFVQTVALNPNTSQSFATGAVEQCDTNRYFRWHYTIRPFGQENPGVLVELREIQLDELGEFEYTIAHWEYVGDPSILYSGTATGITMTPKIPLPPNPNVSCGFLVSSVTIRSTLLPTT